MIHLMLVVSTILPMPKIWNIRVQFFIQKKCCLHSNLLNNLLSEMNWGPFYWWVLSIKEICILNSKFRYVIPFGNETNLLISWLKFSLLKDSARFKLLLDSKCRITYKNNYRKWIRYMPTLKLYDLYRASIIVMLTSFTETWILEEPFLEGVGLVVNAGCLGLGKSSISRVSIDKTVETFGLSSAYSCTHNSPTCTHLWISFLSCSSIILESTNSTILFSFHNFHAWRARVLTMKGWHFIWSGA